MLLALLACAHRIADPGADVAPLPSPAPIAPAPVSPAPDEGGPSAINVPPPALTVCRVEMATGTLPGGVVVARGALRGDVPSTQSGLLLRHPAGTWLVDGGMSSDFAAHLKEIRGIFGVLARSSAKDWVRVATPSEGLARLGAGELTGAILTHGHYDHLGGLLDLPAVPIWAPAEEIAAAEVGATGAAAEVLPSEARALLPRARPIPFDGPAIGPWPRSWDVFGDGSAYVIPMPGHTPGSAGVLVRLADGRRVLHVGDTVWVREGYEQREPKSALASAFDSDRDGIERQIQLLWQLHRADPDLLILPAHDRRQWELLFAGGDCVR